MIRHAVVIGGGIGGLLAARALIDKCQKVTIVERSHYPDLAATSAPPVRQGVPQSRCLHLLMDAGAAAFDLLTPGWRNKLIALGAVPFDASADAETRMASGWLPRVHSGITLYAASRSLLEHVLRQEFQSATKTQLRTGERVVGLLHDRSCTKITGVQTKQSQSGFIRKIHAELVVDSSGLTSALPGWLAHCLPDAPKTGQPCADSLRNLDTTVEPGRRYVSCWFHLAENDAPDWHCLSIAPGSPPHEHRSAMMLRAENQCWGVVLVDSSGDPLPSNPNSFLNFTAEIGDGKLSEALRDARPISPIHRLQPAANRWRHYDRIDRWPSGLVALGDSVCALDPYFGMGMTVAARSAVLLRNMLDKQPLTVLHGSAFQRELAQLNTQPWQLATGCDTDGEPLSTTDAHALRARLEAPLPDEIVLATQAEHHLSCSIESQLSTVSP